MRVDANICANIPLVCIVNKTILGLWASSGSLAASLKVITVIVAIWHTSVDQALFMAWPGKSPQSKSLNR